MQMAAPKMATKFGIFEYALPLTPEVARVYAEQAAELAVSKNETEGGSTDAK
jgi:hypothetical protein